MSRTTVKRSGLKKKKDTPVRDDAPIMDLILDVVPNAQFWIDSPNTLFGGESPRTMIERDQAERVRKTVLDYKYGNFA
jgi:hypothetical protein